MKILLVLTTILTLVTPITSRALFCERVATSFCKRTGLRVLLSAMTMIRPSCKRTGLCFSPIAEILSSKNFNSNSENDNKIVLFKALQKERGEIARLQKEIETLSPFVDQYLSIKIGSYTILKPSIYVPLRERFFGAPVGSLAYYREVRNQLLNKRLYFFRKNQEKYSETQKRLIQTIMNWNAKKYQDKN